MVKDIANFKDATRLYYSNDEVANYNFEKLSALNQPIARLNALHSGDMAKRSTPHEMSGLEPVIFSSNRATCYAHNEFVDRFWALQYGATGVVLDFIYATNHQPPDLPIAVLV